MKILILKPSSLGDVVQALPVLRLLKQHLPKSEIYWWIDAGLEGFLQNDPDLAGTIRFERKRWASPLHWDEMFRSIRDLRRQHFDLVIDLQGLARSGVFAWLANGDHTIGVDDPREGATCFYDETVRRPSAHTHAVDWYLEILHRLGIPVHKNFTWFPENPLTKGALELKWKTNSSRWITINPGARWNNKLWPAEYYTEVVRQLSAKSDFKFAILGDRSSTHLAEEISAGAPDRCLDLTGQTSLREMIEWLRLSELTITNDTGPMHVAAALGKPVVAIFGPTEPRRTGPYGQIDTALRVSLPCAPCMKSTCANSKPLECLRAISPFRVCQEVQRHLKF
ncbi:MAG: Lipopolysaccharide core heptosyltransferase RfaQ [Verrucomicrobiales bacterium]|nr:Lipopolysaccharide core heptosyltransferase RfaQ [Verrucomicrobiales bacterium]